MSKTPRGLEDRRNPDGKFGSGRLPANDGTATARANMLAADDSFSAPGNYFAEVDDADELLDHLDQNFQERAENPDDKRAKILDRQDWDVRERLGEIARGPGPISGLGDLNKADPTSPAPRNHVVRSLTHDGSPVKIMTDVGGGMPGITITGEGRPDSARELRDRARAAIISSGYQWPDGKIVVNLDTETRYIDSNCDAAIATSILVASGQVEEHSAPDTVWGELSLDGTVRER